MRNIIICCDGTGNEISENISNVLKLYRCLRKTERTSPWQLVYCDPGVGTLARPDPWHRLKRNFQCAPLCQVACTIVTYMIPYDPN